MKKLTLSILSASCLFMGSVSALTVIDRNGNIHQSEPKQTQHNHYSYKNKKIPDINKPARKEYYNEWDQLEGYSQKNAYSDRTTHHDWLGQYQGHSKKDRYSGEVKHYDEWGQYQGSTKHR
jgi:hypothetical protein